MQNHFSALIVDDERRASSLLKKLLDDTCEFAALYCADSGSSALDLVRRHHPDLIFLDIKMPRHDGFEFLSHLHDAGLQCEIVFVTAHSEFAMQALKSHAFDYLMKPVERADLVKCIESFRQRREYPEVSGRLQRFLEDYEANRKVRFNTRTGFFQVDPLSIVYCRADGNYTHIHTGDREQLCTLNLGTVQELLPRQGFLRIGRSLIINSHYIYKVDRKLQEITFEKVSHHFSLNLPVRQIRELDRLME